MSTYNKPHLSFQEQLNLLKSRGLEITNDKISLEYLSRLGYYRLSGYLYPFRELLSLPIHTTKLTRPSRKDEFMKGATFQAAVELYVFDKRLRLLSLDAIERIEVAFRVDIAYLLGKKDRFAYVNPTLLHGSFSKRIDPKTGKTKHYEWLAKHNQLIDRSKEDFVKHYKDKYGLPLPIWVAIELWDFGMLSTFYKGMTVNDKMTIAVKYGIRDWQIMESWLRCLNYVRNVAAHHSRLWNRNLIDQPKLPKKGSIPQFDCLIANTHTTSRIYIVLCILAYFMDYVCPRSSWINRVTDLLHSFPENLHVHIQDMGFPKDWEHHTPWKR